LNWSYRKITKKFNDEWKIRTHTGKTWGNWEFSLFGSQTIQRERRKNEIRE